MKRLLSMLLILCLTLTLSCDGPRERSIHLSSKEALTAKAKEACGEETLESRGTDAYFAGVHYGLNIASCIFNGTDCQ